jgi:hypothetical protein
MFLNVFQLRLPEFYGNVGASCFEDGGVVLFYILHGFSKTHLTLRDKIYKHYKIKYTKTI